MTYDWWDKEWLNEGFATFFEYELIERLVPQEHPLYIFYTRGVRSALARDSLQSTAPMTFEGPRPTLEIDYLKSSAVIRMFRAAIGDELFRAALHKYLVDKYVWITIINTIKWAIKPFD